MKNKNSNKVFGIFFFFILISYSLYPLLNSENIRIGPTIISIIFLILGLMNSKILTPFNKIWIKFGIILGKFISPVLLSLIYFGVVFPTYLIVKIFKKNYLGIKFDSNLRTYWISTKNEKLNIKNQF